MTISQKNIYAIGSENNYLEALAREIISITENFENLSDAIIMLPSRRSGAILKTEFLNETGKKSLLMPKTISLGDIDETELELDELEFDIDAEKNISLKIIPKHKRIMLLAELVRKAGLFGYDMNKLSMHQSVKLAYSLAELIDEFQKYGSLDSKNLREILPEELSQHKQYTLDFISFIETEYPKILEKNGYIDAVRKRNLLVERYIKLLQTKNPKNHIIIAGSSGSLPSTRKLIKVVLELQNGYFFLPNFDKETNLIYDLLKYLKVNEEEIRFLGNNKIENNIKIIETENDIEEAKISGLIIREKLEKNSKVALVTNNKNLAKRTRDYLQKWNINIDDSSGTKFSNTEEGNFILQICEFIGNKKSINLLALLKNKFCSIDESIIVTLEKEIREKNIIQTKNISTDNGEIKKLINLTEKNNKFRVKICDVFNDVYEIINLLTNEDFWERNNIKEASEILNFLLSEEASSETEVEYLSEFAKNIFDVLTIRPKFGVTASAAILSPMEARLLSFDCIILGGLNYGSWPKRVSSAWFSDNMKRDAELPDSDFYNALSSHDFTSLLHNKEVIITRSKKESGEITIESPFLTRVKSNFKFEEETKYFDYLEQLETPVEIKTPQKIYPKPPLEARPSKLSVTNIKKLIENPYEIYVSKILKLKKLDEIEREGEAKDYGSFVHSVLEKFTLFHELNQDKITEENFLKITDEVFAEYQAQNIAQEVWRYNCKAIAADYIKIEKERAKNIKEIFCEKSGIMKLDINGHEFDITCKADRIEITKDNKLVIIDYKTGMASIPSKSDVKRLKEPQLLLELLMFENGSFEMIDKNNYKISEKEVAYFLISKSANGPKIEDREDFDLELLQENLRNLITDLLNPQKPFLISPRIDLQPKYREYKHLERYEG